MTTIYIFLAFLIMLFGIRIINNLNKFSKRMLTLYVSYWGIALSLSSVGVANLYRPSNFTLFVLSIAVFMFVLGFSVLKRTKYERMPISKDFFVAFNRFIDSYIFTSILLIAFVISMYYFLRVRITLNNIGSLAEVRTMYFQNELLGHSYVWIDHLFLHPMKYICIPIFGYMLMYKQNWKLIIVTSFILCYTSLSGGRFGYLSIIIGCIFILYVCLYNIKIRFKQYMVLVITILLLLCLIIIVTKERSIDEESTSIIDSFLRYLCGPITAFDYAINNDYVGKLGGFQFGRYTFSSIDRWVMYFFQMLGLNYSDLFIGLGKLKQETIILVGDNLYWNALYTGTLYYWLDGGLIGCIIFPFILGMLYRWIVKLFFKYKSWSFFVLVAMFFQMKIHSVCDFSLYSPFLLLSIIIIYIIGKHKLTLK